MKFKHDRFFSHLFVYKIVSYYILNEVQKKAQVLSHVIKNILKVVSKKLNLSILWRHVSYVHINIMEIGF